MFLLLLILTGFLLLVNNKNIVIMHKLTAFLLFIFMYHKSRFARQSTASLPRSWHAAGLRSRPALARGGVYAGTEAAGMMRFTAEKNKKDPQTAKKVLTTKRL